MARDIRWIQRLDNYTKALASLERAASLARERELSELEKLGLIQGFEFTHELAWNMLKDYLVVQGFSDIHGLLDAVRLAFKEELIEEGETWMDMIKSRNLSSHTYNLSVAEEICAAVLSAYLPEFQRLRDSMAERSKRE